MAHRIRLEQDHQDLIAQALLRSLHYKERHVVKNREKLAETERQYIDAMEKFQKGITCGNVKNNIFTWLADQIKHSGPLKDQELGRRVMDLCAVCAQDRYDDYISDRGIRFSELFEIDGAK